MPKKNSALAIQLLRLGEYISAFGARSGIALALEHQLKFKLWGGKAPRSTRIAGWGSVFLRPRTSDLATFREIFVNGEYDAHRLGLMPILKARYDQVQKQGRTPLVVDAGANIGLASRYLSRFFPLAEFLLVEASSETATMARMNVEAIPRYRIVEAALWGEAGTIRLLRSDDASTRRVGDVGDAASFDEVAAVTLDELVEDRRQDLFLVKIDIEGAEKCVLSPLAAWLSAAPVLMIEPHDGMMNEHGSLAGLFALEDYRNGKIMLSGSTMMLVPASLCTNT